MNLTKSQSKYTAIRTSLIWKDKKLFQWRVHFEIVWTNQEPQLLFLLNVSLMKRMEIWPKNMQTNKRQQQTRNCNIWTLEKSWNVCWNLETRHICASQLCRLCLLQWLKKIGEIATIFLVSTCHHAEDHNLKQFFSFRIHTITWLFCK